MEATAMIAELADKAKLAARTLIAASDSDRVEALIRISDEIISSEVEILAANADDIPFKVRGSCIIVVRVLRTASFFAKYRARPIWP